MKIATWNVNSLRVRLPQVLDWLAQHQPDVFALQETKITDPEFPVQPLQEAGYHAVFCGQKAYNGVAILSKKILTDVVTEIPELQDTQRRVLCASLGDIKILNLYVPNGESVDSEKYQYKLNWLHHLDLFLKNELLKHEKIIILGDFNIAPEEIDVHDPKQWQGRVLFSDKERAAFQDILKLGFKDCFRLQPQPEKSFSWWDYRLNAFKRNLGLRIDHILASKALTASCSRCYIDKIPRTAERPSDHTIVVADFD